MNGLFDFPFFFSSCAFYCSIACNSLSAFCFSFCASSCSFFSSFSAAIFCACSFDVLRSIP